MQSDGVRANRRMFLKAARLIVPLCAFLGHATSAWSETERLFHGVGVVTAADAGDGSLTIRHGPIEGLMPAMEMSFQADPPSLVRNVKVGDRVGFDLTAKGYTVKKLDILDTGRQ